MRQTIGLLSLGFFLSSCGSHPLTDTTISLSPSPTGMLCPYQENDSSSPPATPPAEPGLTGYLAGDREFSGNGPDITLDVALCISANGSTCILGEETGARIIAFIDFDARETDAGGAIAGDSTRIMQRFIYPIYPADPAGSATVPIISIDSPTRSTITARGPAAGAEFVGCNDGTPIGPSRINYSGGLVSRVSLTGDTGADDVSRDPDCGCDTRINTIEFNQVRFTLSGAVPGTSHIAAAVPTAGVLSIGAIPWMGFCARGDTVEGRIRVYGDYSGDPTDPVLAILEVHDVSSESGESPVRTNVSLGSGTTGTFAVSSGSFNMPASVYCDGCVEYHMEAQTSGEESRVDSTVRTACVD